MRLQPALCLIGLGAGRLGRHAAERPGAEAHGAAGIANSASVEVPAGSRLVYVSGQVPDVVNPAAAEGSVERFGDTEAQTRSSSRKIDGVLKQQWPWRSATSS